MVGEIKMPNLVNMLLRKSGKVKRVILNRTCHWCGELYPSEDVTFRLAHEGGCEKCPDGKCSCIKKMKRYWTCNDCINSGDMCCRYDSDE